MSGASAASMDHGTLDRIAVASWIPLPDPGCPDVTWFGSGYDVLVIDCYDEMLRPRAWPTGLAALRAARWLRELARRSNTAVVLTARAARPAGLGRHAFDDSWHGHWAKPLFDDIADLRLELSPGKDGGRAFLATARGVGPTVDGTLRLVDGTILLQPA